MKNFQLILTEEPSFGDRFEWRVTARREYKVGADSWHPKFDDSMLYDAQVKRVGLNFNSNLTANLDANKLFEFIAEAYRNLRIPLIGVYFPIGADGTFYSVEFFTYKGFGSVKIFWWSDYPEEWKPMTKWFREMTTFLDDAIENQAL
jgi:hypothetical protein